MAPPLRPVAIDLDGALVETRPLWDAWLASAAAILGVQADALPADRGAAAQELDDLGAGNWRTLLARFAEDRAPVFLRREAGVSAAVRALVSSGRAVAVFTDAPEELARVALAHLGIGDVTLATGRAALERLGDADVIRTRAELAAYASTPAS
jgi:phosphoglycolate phosphatase-like HAD superfamily hydrolase